MIQFLGIKTDDTGWKHFAWLATLNGVDIEYKTGIGHCKIANSVDKGGVITGWGLKKRPPGYLKAQHISSEFSKRADIYRALGIKPVIANESVQVFIKIPRVRDILHSLYMDYSCSQGTFEDFCSNMGYDTDSRRALDTYLACQESGAKLRKIMKSENHLERIAAWEL